MKPPKASTISQVYAQRFTNFYANLGEQQTKNYATLTSGNTPKRKHPPIRRWLQGATNWNTTTRSCNLSSWTANSSLNPTEGGINVSYGR